MKLRNPEAGNAYSHMHVAPHQYFHQLCQMKFGACPVIITFSQSKTIAAPPKCKFKLTKEFKLIFLESAHDIRVQVRRAHSPTAVWRRGGRGAGGVGEMGRGTVVRSESTPKENVSKRYSTVSICTTRV